MPATTDYLPRKESDLVVWSAHFESLVSADPAAYGLDLGQAAAFTVLNTTWVDAYVVANANNTRTPSAIAAKNIAKFAMVANARELAGIVQADPAVTDVQKLDLGLTVHDVEPTPVPVPIDPPTIDVLASFGRTVKIRLHEQGNPTSRAKPVGVAGAIVFTFVGATPPNELKDWDFATNTTKTSMDVVFDPATADGAKVWLTSYWYNTRAESGPSTPPVTINLPGGLAAAA